MRGVRMFPDERGLMTAMARVMSAVRAAYRTLASPALAATLLISWAGLLVIWVIPFQFYGLPAEQLRAIMAEPFFVFVYAGLLVATAACMSLRIGSAVRMVRRMPSPESRPRTPSESAHVGEAWDEQRTRRVLSASGFRTTVSGDGWVWGVRNRYSPLGTAVFHASFFLIAAAALLATQPGDAFVGKCVVAEGETFSAVEGEYSDELTPDADRPDLKFTPTDIEAEFHQDILLFTKLDGRIIDGDGRSRRIRLGSPWLVSPTTMVGIEDFGYSVEVTGTASDGKPIASQVIKLKAFPSGQRDSLVIRDVAKNEYDVEVTIFSDYVDRNGRPGSASFNLANPRMLISVSKRLTDGTGLLRLKDRLVAVGEPIEWDGNTLIISSIPEYGVFRITRFGNAPIMFAGVLLLLAGACMRLVWPRSQVLAFRDESGKTRLSVANDTYRDAHVLESSICEALASADGSQTS